MESKYHWCLWRVNNIGTYGEQITLVHMESEYHWCLWRVNIIGAYGE